MKFYGSDGFIECEITGEKIPLTGDLIRDVVKFKMKFPFDLISVEGCKVTMLANSKILTYHINVGNTGIVGLTRLEEAIVIYNVNVSLQ